MSEVDKRFGFTTRFSQTIKTRKPTSTGPAASSELHRFQRTKDIFNYGLAVKTGSIALQKFFGFVFDFFSFFFGPKKFVIWGQNIFFQIRLKKQMGHHGLLFLIF